MNPEASDSKRRQLTYGWYIFVLKAGSIERCIGTRLEEDGELFAVYDQQSLTFSVPKSDVVDHWQQARRVTKVGEQRVKQAAIKK